MRLKLAVLPAALPPYGVPAVLPCHHMVYLALLQGEALSHLVVGAGVVLLQREVPEHVNMAVAQAAATAGVPVIQVWLPVEDFVRVSMSTIDCRCHAGATYMVSGWPVRVLAWLHCAAGVPMLLLCVCMLRYVILALLHLCRMLEVRSGRCLLACCRCCPTWCPTSLSCSG
jgi:hypothetical protein